MSNRTPHRDYQATYSMLLKVPMDRTLSPEVGEMLDSPMMRDQTLAELTRLMSGQNEEMLTFMQAAHCPRCSAVFIHYPHEAEDGAAVEWLRNHDIVKHGAVPPYIADADIAEPVCPDCEFTPSGLFATPCEAHACPGCHHLTHSGEDGCGHPDPITGWCECTTDSPDPIR